MIDVLFNPVSLGRICGLRPEIWISVGAGFAREDIKTLLLAHGRGFVGEAIVNLQEICSKIVGIKSDQILTSSARQEILRLLLAESRITSGMKELKRMRRQRNFVRRLDSAIQTGRMAFAHSLEEEVYEERLKQVLGENSFRPELRGLAKAYEAWSDASSSFDLPILIYRATQILRDQGWPTHLNQPQEIWALSVQNPESLEKEFWETLKENIQVRNINSLRSPRTEKVPAPLFGDCPVESLPRFQWQKWHTLDDAAEALVDQLLNSPNQAKGTLDLNDHAVLIPDLPSVRRSLKRALESRGLPLADPRDPTRLRWDEWVKWALLPIEVVAKNFERQKVISWLHGFEIQIRSQEGADLLDATEGNFPKWVTEINNRGIRSGLSSYSGGILSDIYLKLVELESRLGGRRTCQDLFKNHIKILRHRLGSESQNSWLISFFESIQKGFMADLKAIAQEEKRAPPLFWLERLQARLREASPPVERLKPDSGIRIYRLQQAPILSAPFVWVFGLPPHWLTGDESGSFWFSEREREILASEFAVRSSVQVREERLQLLKDWFSGADEIIVLDAHYDSDGRERESILPILKELEVSLGYGLAENSEDRGAHARYSKSYGVIRPIQPQQVNLPPLEYTTPRMHPEISATAVDRYSRCSFQALIFHRWKLRDIRDPDSELWPDVRGTILHEAVKLLLKSMDLQGGFSLSSAEALEKAWQLKRPVGLLKSRRIENYVKNKLKTILDVFCEKEREYYDRSGSRPVNLDESKYRIEYSNFSIVGQPDRIDQHADGLFILDYKSSGTVPHGTDMIERGYRLQLPFYALAVQKKFSKPVLGVQFVELDRKGGRRNGIFFKMFNGKGPGTLTQVRSNSKSLTVLSPEAVWNRLEETIIKSATSYIQGKFEAKPNTASREKECKYCGVSSVCGFRRISTLQEETLDE